MGEKINLTLRNICAILSFVAVAIPLGLVAMGFANIGPYSVLFLYKAMFSAIILFPVSILCGLAGLNSKLRWLAIISVVIGSLLALVPFVLIGFATF